MNLRQWQHRPLLLSLIAIALAGVSCGDNASGGPITNVFGLDAVCMTVGADTPFLVAPGEIVLQDGQQLTELSLIFASGDPNNAVPVEVFLAAPDDVAAGDVYSPESGRYESIEFLALPGDGETSVEGPSKLTIVLHLTDTMTAQEIVLEGAEYTLNGTQYLRTDLFELSLADKC